MFMGNTKYIKYFFSFLMVFFLLSIACTASGQGVGRAHQSTEFRGEQIRTASLDSKNSMIQTAIFWVMKKRKFITLKTAEFSMEVIFCRPKNE